MSELNELIQYCENYISTNGINEKVIKAYVDTCRLAKGNEDKDGLLKCTERTKQIINRFCKQEFDCDIWAIEKAYQGKGQQVELVNTYYDILKLEAKEVFESFMLYMERKRPVEERFYQPRIYPMRRVAQGIQELVDDKLDEVFVNCPSRVGKANPLYSKILTPDGFVEMRDIKVGSKVISGNGTVCNVTGVFPQGVKDVYRVHFSDGTSADCCKEHLWRVQSAEDRKDETGNKYQVLELQEICKKLKKRKLFKTFSNYSIDCVKPVRFSKKQLPIPPYFCGAMLTDVGIMEDYVQYKNAWKRLGFDNEYSDEKVIPKDYLYSDVTDRMELLRGMYDALGIVEYSNIEYNAVSKQLAEDIAFLVRSLGGTAKISENGSCYIRNRMTVERRKSYKVTIEMNDTSKPLKKFIDRVEYVGKEKCQCIMVDDPQHLYVMDDFIVTHNTQIVKLGFLWYGSKFPEKSNLYTAYSDKITSAFYDGVIELITDPTYTYAEMFPENVQKKLITDGKDTTIDIIRKKTYPTFTMRSIYGTLNGACDCSGIAVADDLFSGIEEAVSVDRQKTVWDKFDNNFMKRLKRKAKLINMGTRWAVQDVQGRRRNLLENNKDYKTRRWQAIVIPALNENEESNFDYPYDLGYSTKDYLMIRASFEENDDMASWYAQDQQEPIERLGALFTTDNLNYFNPSKDLPDSVPDRIFAAIDPAYGGGDYVSMPICYQFGKFYYIVDVVYNDGEKDVTVPEVTNRIAYHLEKFAPKTAEVHFEENKSTEGYRMECEKQWKALGVPVNATHSAAPNNISKVDRIKNHAPEIRKLYFIDREHRTKEYNKYFQNILTFKTEGKNKHDDGIDSTAQLCDMIYGNKRIRKTTIISSPI